MDTMSRHLLIFFLLPKNGSILAPLTLTHKCRSLEIVPIVMGEKTLCEKEPCCREIRHRGALSLQRQSCSLFQVLSQGRCLSIASGWLGDGLANKSLLLFPSQRFEAPESSDRPLSTCVKREDWQTVLLPIATPLS